MKIPSFMKTIRFRITLWYVSFFIILVFALVLVLNVKMVLMKYLSIKSLDKSHLGDIMKMKSSNLGGDVGGNDPPGRFAGNYLFL